MYGFSPTQSWHLWALVVPATLWLLLWPVARWRRSVLLHNASQLAAYSEEVLFRGLMWGFILQLGYSQWIALGITSILFGLVHLRNLWWNSPGKVLRQCLYTGLIFAPAVGLLRMWSGDIYLGIAIHGLNNALALYGRRGQEVHTDAHLRSRSKR